jgi:hypothetical protein
MLQFRGLVVTSDAGLLTYRELDDALDLSVMASEALADARSGRNGRYALECCDSRCSVGSLGMMAAAKGQPFLAYAVLALFRAF